jgi:hypothetical protein
MTEPEGISRRELALRSARVGAVATMPALLAGGLTLPGAAAAQNDDNDNSFDTLLLGPIGIEQTLVAVYDEAARSSRLNPADRRLVAVLGEQSAEHARILRAELTEDAEIPLGLGVQGLGAGTSAREYFETALSFENQAYFNYLDAIGSLPPEDLSVTIAAIAASTAQHLALLRIALGREPILAPAELGATV